MFAVKRIFGRVQIPLRRTYGTNSKLVEVTHQEDTGIATISMASPPVNSLNTEMLGALNESLVNAQNQRYKGVILTSSLQSIFTGGLDIREMYNRDVYQLEKFWTTLQDTWLTLYGLEIPVAAAVNGASPGAGCLLALSCEYRVLVDGKHTIGLNETQLGIAAPEWFKNLYVDVMGYRNAEIGLLRGTLFRPQEALKVGLVDELATDKEDAIKKCQEYIQSFKRIPDTGRLKTKMELRKRNLLWLKVNKNMDVNEFLTFVQSPEVQANLKTYIELLKKK